MSDESSDIPVSELTDHLAGPLADQLGEELSQLVEQIAKESGPALKPKTPREAVDKYFETRNLVSGSEKTHRSSLYNFFLDWCENVAEIDNMNDLTGDDLENYRVWRRDEASDRVEKLNPKSEETQQKILRIFIDRCEAWEAVRPGLHEYVIIPDLDKEDEIRDEILPSERAKSILEWLKKYEYASLEHVVWLLLAACGARIGGIHSLDLDDYKDEAEEPYLQFRHRPETGTTLKNKEGGERDVSLPKLVREALTDYIENHRKQVTDEHGRKPLLTTSHGRPAKSTLRNYVYAWTRPCMIGQECPYGRDIDECDAAKRNNWAFKCPESLSCHPVRKGYLTAELKAGVPKEILSERCDLTEKVMEKHYDKRTKEEKMTARMNALKLAHDENSGYVD